MKHAIHIEKQKSSPVLEIKSEVPILKVQKTLASNWAEIKTHIDQSKTIQLGTPYARFLDVNWQHLTSTSPFLQIKQLLFAKQIVVSGIRTKIRTDGKGIIQSKELAPGRCVQAKHFGAHDKVVETYKLMLNWAREHRLELSNNPIEIYTHAPGDVSVEEIETVILIPIKS